MTEIMERLVYNNHNIIFFVPISSVLSHFWRESILLKNVLDLKAVRF